MLKAQPSWSENMIVSFFIKSHKLRVGFYIMIPYHRGNGTVEVETDLSNPYYTHWFFTFYTASQPANPSGVRTFSDRERIKT